MDWRSDPCNTVGELASELSEGRVGVLDSTSSLWFRRSGSRSRICISDQFSGGAGVRITEPVMWWASEHSGQASEDGCRKKPMPGKVFE